MKEEVQAKASSSSYFSSRPVQVFRLEVSSLGVQMMISSQPGQDFQGK